MSDNEGRNAVLSFIVGALAVIGVLYALLHAGLDGVGGQWIGFLVIIGIIVALVKINKK